MPRWSRARSTTCISRTWPRRSRSASRWRRVVRRQRLRHVLLDLDGTPGHEWRFVGVVFTNAAVQFQDDANARHLANYFYNRWSRRYPRAPATTDRRCHTFYNLPASATFAKINGGTGDTVSFLTFDELGVTLGVCASVRANGAADSHVGLAVNDHAAAP